MQLIGLKYYSVKKKVVIASKGEIIECELGKYLISVPPTKPGPALSPILQGFV